ncbi:uncharacterized protein [Arachis hypogaea]|uniref:uncharacterized protein n=1 Tax=Arachis hypogaea TaxID=3818 RepID=UPI000DECE963|nr:uncharacterized protein LOC112719873 [Arachis hypogaea]QHO18390.1 uncharacterized protein DS421_11g320090 [Arachis hypogaea]
MLQWMGGSRKNVNTSRMSTQKRQKQYFEQKKRQQQNLQMLGLDNCTNSTGITAQNRKQHRSLDILNLLNLSTNTQKCDSSHLKGRDDGESNISTLPNSISANQPTIFANMDTNVDTYRFEEAKAGSYLCRQIETSPKKILTSFPTQKNPTVNQQASQSKTVNDQYSELSVIDLLCCDEPTATVEKCPTCEDHVSFSLEGLGKVGTETPVHSPEQARIPRHHSPLLKNGRKSKMKNLDYVLDDIELEVDTMMEDIKVSPISNSQNFPFNKVKLDSAVAGDRKHYYDYANKKGSTVSEEFFYTTENSKESLWNVGSGFLEKQFDNKEGFDDTLWNRTFESGSRSPEVVHGRSCKVGSYAFDEDLPPKPWSSATAMKEINTSERPTLLFNGQLENDFDFYMPRGARCPRLDVGFNAENLVPEDIRDNSSLQSDESCSSTAVMGEAIKHSSSRLRTEDNRRNRIDAFASTRNKCSTKEEKRSSMSNPSKRKSSHYSTSILQEELSAHNIWQFEERCVSVDRSSGATSFCQDLEENFPVFGAKNKTEDPFNIFTNPELQNKVSASSGGFKRAALADSPPRSFTSHKFAFPCSKAFPDAGSWPMSSGLSPDFQFKEKPQDAAGFHRETSSSDTSAQGSASKGERKVRLQKHRCNTFEQGEDIFMGDNELSSDKKMERDASNSNNHKQEGQGTEDTNPKTTESLEKTDDSPNHVEEISSSMKKANKHENKVEKRESNCDAENPLKYETTEEEIKNWGHEGGRNTTVSGKHSNEHTSLSGQVMIETYVFQLLCVQKVWKEACTSTTPGRNNPFLGPGSDAIFHRI